MRDKLADFYNTSNAKNSNQTHITNDKKWEYYNGLYPEYGISYEFISNNQVLKDFLYQGDFLVEKRNVKHWAFFSK